MFILTLFPIPYHDFYVKTHRECEHTYIYSQLVVAFMWLRCFFLIRCVLNYCMFTTAYSKYLCWSYGFSADTRFTLKCWMMRNPTQSIFGLLVTTIFTFAYLLRICELPNFSQNNESEVKLQDYMNALWCIVITLTTVGYGDISPSTLLGRGVAMATALWGAFLLSLIVYCLNTAFHLTYDQDSALSKIRLANIAADTIKKSIKLFVAKKRYVKERIKQDFGPGEYPEFCHLLAVEEAKSGTFVNMRDQINNEDNYSDDAQNFQIPVYEKSAQSSHDGLSDISLIFAERDNGVDASKLAMDCLLAFQEMTNTLMEFKKERSRHNTLIYNNSGRK